MNVEAFDALGIAAEARAPLGRWLDLLADWNKRIDLTAARSDAELGDLRLADAAQLATHIGPGARVVDDGTGAGAPGLILDVATGWRIGAGTIRRTRVTPSASAWS